MSSKYANNACIRCSIKQIKCDNKEVCNNCDKTKNDCHRNKAIKQEIKKQQKLNRSYKYSYKQFEACYQQILQAKTTGERGMLNRLLNLSKQVEALHQQILQTINTIHEQRMSKYYFNNLGFNNNNQVEALRQQILHTIKEQIMTSPLLNHDLDFGNNNQGEQSLQYLRI
ncbi:17830_t:CDS:2 [Entrophospora sp. SA101]|nr:17830_t:CDS:2 [Entrophospora sp. SA101]CAJ0843233.1 18473_t:CDS:2 [Entrophospora sp. SA101]